MHREAETKLITPRSVATRTARKLAASPARANWIDGTNPTNFAVCDALWDTDQVAKFLNVSASWVAKNRDLIPHIKLGRRILHEPSRIRDFVRACAA